MREIYLRKNMSGSHIKKEFHLDFEQTFSEYYQSLCLYTNSYLENMEESTYVAQDVFITLWEKRGSFDDEASLRQYMYTTARNKALNILRKRKAGMNYSRDLAYALPERAHHDRYIEEETFRILFREIDKLPEQQRQVIIYSLDHKNNTEIAELLNISVNTVKFHKKNAYKILREKLSSQYFLLLLLLAHL